MAAADSGNGDAGGGGGVEKMVTLVSSDGARFEVGESAASLSGTVHRMMGEAAGVGDPGTGGGGIPLPKVDGRTLAMVLEYCNKHAPAPGQEESSSAEMERFDGEFTRVDRDTLYALVMAADYLKIQGLVDLACKTVAGMIVGKTTEQIREIFGIQSDFTSEEDEELRRENAWAFH
nr:unnamed protein product [Digitaria exilis]